LLNLCHVSQRFFAERGYRVETCSDALACLAKLRREIPTVLVLHQDLLWGGSEGVLAWLREEDLTHRVPVVLTTTTRRSEPGSELAEPPVVRCLLKPFPMRALLESVASAAASQKDLCSPQP
jgi:DNA-binding response OmpR family regulator